MSIAKAIYDAPIVRESIVADTSTMIAIRYNGKIYTGYADLHPDDIDFFSKKVGKNIALSRARKKAMKAELKRMEHEYNIINDFYHVAANSVKVEDYSVSEFEAHFTKLLSRKKDKINRLRAAADRETNNLNKYLEGQDRATQSVKRMRNKDKSS